MLSSRSTPKKKQSREGVFGSSHRPFWEEPHLLLGGVAATPDSCPGAHWGGQQVWEATSLPMTRAWGHEEDWTSCVSPGLNSQGLVGSKLSPIRQLDAEVPLNTCDPEEN